MQSQVESGAELLTRLNNKSSLCGLEDTLFFEGLQNTGIVEIGGAQSTGKTLLLCQLLAKCILPNYPRIEGCNASAILINTDHHFQISKLVQSMNNIIDTAHTVSLVSKAVETDFDKTTVIQNSLRNLHIINCYNSEQFSLTLHTLEDIFLNNSETALLAIDSIAAYYWQDRDIKTNTTIDFYVRKLLKPIKVQTTRFNVITMYTRPSENIHYKETKFATNLFGDSINYRVHLFKTHDPQKFVCKSETIQSTKMMNYSILSNNIQWKTNKDE